MTKVQKISPVGDDGVVRCYKHNVQAAHRVSNTPTNPSRGFYCCYKDRDDKDRCKFFLWADDPIFEKKVTPPSTPIMNTSTPRPSQRQRADQARSKTTANHLTTPPGTPMTPREKRLADITTALLDSPAKSKRLLDIEAALAQSPTTTTSQLQPLVFPTTSQAQFPSSHPQTSSRTGLPSQSPPLEVEDVFSAARTGQNKEPVQYRLPDVQEQGPAKRVKLSHPSDDSAETENPGGSRKSSGLPTPPRTSKHGHLMTPRNIELPQTPTTKGKGKARDMSNDEPLTQRRGNGMEVEPSTSSQVNQGQPHSAAVKISSESLLDNLEETVSSLRLNMEKLERRRLAADKSNEAKSKRIEHLEEHIREKDVEIQELKTKVGALENTIDALKMRSRV